MKKKSFVLPDLPIDKYAVDTNDKVLVITFFGKSPYNATGCKTGILGNFPGRTMFQPSILDDPVVDKELLCNIEGHYDIQKRIIFLHLRGVYDTYHLVQTCEQMGEELQEKGFLSMWSDLNCRYARALLFLFSVSHILVLLQPSYNFDLSYKQLFRALDIVRQKAQPLLSELLLSGVPQLPSDWGVNARPCSPRVLFAFESCPAIFSENVSICPSTVQKRGFGNGVGFLHTDLADHKPKPSVKKLEHALEDQIYHVLRKSRAVTNTCTNSLFAIPANEEFVFMCVKPDPSRDYMAHLINSLVDQCNTTNPAAQAEDPFSLRLPDTKEHTFKNFIQPHIDQAFGKGFDDNVGRHVTPAHFELVSAGVWGQIVNVVWNFFMNEPADSEKDQASMLSCLNSVLHTDLRFSEERCSKVLPVASATYQENLPQHYPRDYHETMLAHALNVFSIHARGPMFEQYAARLAEECEAHWKAGHQVCEVLSLTGNPCTNPLHRGGGEGAGGGELQAEDSNNVDRQLPVMNHLSGVRYISACNCGRKQGPREDPFSAKEANYEFYVQLGEECGCARFECIAFPVFQPSTQDFRAAQLFSRTGRKDGPKSPEGRDFPVPVTPLGNTQSFSLGQSAKLSAHDSTPEHASQSGFVSGQSGGSDLIQEEVTSHLSCNPPQDTSPPEGHEIIIQVSDSESESSKDKFLVRQPSTTEYLPGMLHTDSPLGLLPQYPSWSLICLGPSSLYSHNLGLQEQQQAGLLGGSAHLLPWDVTVRVQQHRERCWPAVGDQMYSSRSKIYPGAIHSGSRIRKPKPPNKDASEFVVKIFVGVEYECPRGHRFMCSGPDKVLKTSGMGLVKDTGNRVTSSDMPLYCPCPCRSAKQLIAQLMRIHVVTPKAPVFVTLSPKVQPALQQSPIFVTGSDQPLRLSQSAYWVLRLPYVYVGDHGPFIAPKDPVSPGYGRLLAGMYSITEQPPDD